MDRYSRREFLRRAFRTVALAPVVYVATTEVIHTGLYSRIPLVAKLFDWLDMVWPH